MQVFLEIFVIAMGVWAGGILIWLTNLLWDEFM